MRTTCAILISLLLWGCAAARKPLRFYDAARGTTTFESPKVLVGNINMTSGLAGGQRVMMQAFATCRGEGCAPSVVEIAFFNDSSTDLNLDYRRLRIIFDDESREWEDTGRMAESPRSFVPRGEFIRVPLSRREFNDFASAREVEVEFGLTATNIFRLSSERRKPLRDLAATF